MASFDFKLSTYKHKIVDNNGTSNLRFKLKLTKQKPSVKNSALEPIPKS